MKPIISVIIPVYNTSEYLKRCIDSVLQQTFEKIEIILVDDGSGDESLAICESYAKKHHNVFAFSKQNSGASETRSYGVNKSVGDWICFVDSDDALPVCALESLYNKAAISKADIVLGGWYKILTNGEKKIRKICVSGVLSSEQYVKSLLQLRCYAGPVGKIFKKELFDANTFNIDSQISHNEDLLMNINLALKAQSIAVYPTMEVYWYYTNEGSISHQPTHIGMWDKVMQELDKSLGYEYRKMIDYYIATVVYKNWEDGLLDKLEPSFIYDRLLENIKKHSICSGLYLYSICITQKSKFYTYLLLLHRAMRFFKFKIQQYHIYR